MNPFKKMQIVPSGPLGGITKNKVRQLELKKALNQEPLTKDELKFLKAAKQKK